MVKLLLKHPTIDVNTEDLNGDTPLIIACIEGDFEVVELLLEQPNINVNIHIYF